MVAYIVPVTFALLLGLQQQWRPVGIVFSWGVYLSYLFVFSLPLVLQGDILNYFPWYKNITNLNAAIYSSYASKGDLGFTLLMLLGNSYSLTYDQFIFLQAFVKFLLCTTLIILISWKFSTFTRRRLLVLLPIAFISIPYFHFYNFNVLRQGFGFYFLFLALVVTRPLSSLVLQIMSLMFHKFGIVYLMILHRKRTANIIIFSIVLVVVILLLGTYYFSKVLNYINDSPGFFGTHKVYYFALSIFIALTVKYTTKMLYLGKIVVVDGLEYLIRLGDIIFFITILTMPIYFLSVDMHYRFFTSFFFLFVIYICILTSCIQSKYYHLGYIFVWSLNMMTINSASVRALYV
jgi:hypothetical protein